MILRKIKTKGLPHGHLLLRTDFYDAPQSLQQIDNVICAEIPDKWENPKLYELVMHHTLHVCDDRSPGRPCRRNKTGKCINGYPRAYAKETVVIKGKYPIYRRREEGTGEGQGGIVAFRYLKNKPGYAVTNQDVVPYNPSLLLRHECHLNVEICTYIDAVKYVFKYCLKGPDFIGFTIEPLLAEDAIEKPTVERAGYSSTCPIGHEVLRGIDSTVFAQPQAAHPKR